jgi:hypothetical protein
LHDIFVNFWQLHQSLHSYSWTRRFLTGSKCKTFVPGGEYVHASVVSYASFSEDQRPVSLKPGNNPCDLDLGSCDWHSRTSQKFQRFALILPTFIASTTSMAACNMSFLCSRKWLLLISFVVLTTFDTTSFFVNAMQENELAKENVVSGFTAR